MARKIFRFVFFALLAILFGADRFTSTGISAQSDWRVEKSPANPILSPDNQGLFSNSDFEMGDWTNWRVLSGTAWINRPAGCVGAPNSDVVFGIPDLAGGYRTACSDNGGDSAIGVLTSQIFTIRRQYISFISAGWDGADGTGRSNKIELVRARDDSVLLRASAPSRGTWGIEWWDVSPYQNLPVYIRITDANSNNTHGWIGAGHFYSSDSNWEDFAIRTPGLVHDANGIALRQRDGRYWMFYSGETFNNTKRTTLQRMGLAFSADLLHWLKLGKPIISFGAAGAFDEFQTADPDVISVNGTLWMFYAGNDRSSPINNPQLDRGKVGLAWCKESTDCTSPANWTKYKNPATGNALLSPPPGDNFWGMSVLHEDGRWKMWVDRYYQGTGEQIDYLYTDDPHPNTTNWVRHAGNPVWSIRAGCGGGRSSGEIGQPSVFKYGQKYYMVYHRNCGRGGINTGLATSPDGIHWTASEEKLLLTGDPGKWDAAQIHMPFATVINGECYILYSGAKVYTNDLNMWSIGSARIVNFAAHE
jgi:predicted GH43/DUF377 family glycosyl hydrolase